MSTVESSQTWKTTFQLVADIWNEDIAQTGAINDYMKDTAEQVHRSCGEDKMGAPSGAPFFFLERGGWVEE